MRRGFSLIELIIVVIIVGMLATVAVPRMASAGLNTRLEGAQSRLESEFLAVGELARAAGASHLVRFDVANSQLQVFEGRVVSKSGLVHRVAFTASPYEVRFASVSISPAAATILVDAHGMYSGTAVLTIESGGVARKVSLAGPMAGPAIEAAAAAEESGEDGLVGGLLNGVLGAVTELGDG